MENRFLGQTPIRVSRLCFGTLTISPLQRDLDEKEAVGLLRQAYESGVNFFDTAELYQNYSVLKAAFAGRPDAVIATKSYAHDAGSADAGLKKALSGLGRDVIDIFLLHEQESAHTLRGHREAIDFLLEKKRQGVIRAFGISTHHVAGVKAAVRHGGIDVVHAICNISGFGIADGTREEMEEAILEASNSGIGIYGMKALGGGHLIGTRDEALRYAFGLAGVDAVAVGIQSAGELAYNLALAEGKTPDKEMSARTESRPRKLFIHRDWCTGCGACAERCQNRALRMEAGTACVDEEKCRLCSYCAGVCPVLAIKVI